MHFSELTAPEQRVLGCLIEKRWTTPEQYPLSLNALRLACNQSTNRDPVTHYDEHTVREAAQRLFKYGLARLASGHSSRAIKFRHLAEEALGLGREELAVLAVLLLRGAQTPGELKARTERMAPLGSLEHVDAVLSTLIERGYARRIDRRPGQKEDRFEQLLGGAGDGEPVSHPSAPPVSHPSAPPVSHPSAPPVSHPSAPPVSHPAAPPVSHAPVPRVSHPAAPPVTTAPAPPAPPAADNHALEARVAALEAEVASLKQQLDELLS